MTAEHIVNSQANYGVELIGKVRINPSWQTQSNSKFSADQFEVDWEHQVVTCPKGHQSIIWRPKIDNRGLPVVHVHFSQADCRHCPVRKRCTTPKLREDCHYRHKPSMMLYFNDGGRKKRQSLSNSTSKEQE